MIPVQNDILSNPSLEKQNSSGTILEKKPRGSSTATLFISRPVFAGP